MEFATREKTATTASKQPNLVQAKPATPISFDPVLQRQITVQRQYRPLLENAVKLQRQVAESVLQASQIEQQEIQYLTVQRQLIQQQITELNHVPTDAVQQAIQRQQAPKPAMPTQPQSLDDWVTVMRMQAEQTESRRMNSREVMQYTTLQRQVANTIAVAFKQDRKPAIQRYEQYAGYLADLQRHPSSGQVARAALSLMPVSERPAMQRAVNEAVQRETMQQKQDEEALKLYSLQRQLVELEHEATQSVFERIQAKRGSGSPLPEAVRHHLEQGLNHDLSSVRIHDDQEADELAKKVNAIAFTTGADIFFQTGKFDLNTQSGLELLAHEVTHTVQQSKGQVGKGVDPDAGLETEARVMGQKLSHFIPSSKSLIPPVSHKDGLYAPGVYSPQAALSRVQAGAVNHALLNPLRALQRQTNLTIQRDMVEDVAHVIPGGDVMIAVWQQVNGKNKKGDAGKLLDALSTIVPGPFKDMIQVIREKKLLEKAWTWFEKELKGLRLPQKLQDFNNAGWNLVKRKAVLTDTLQCVTSLARRSLGQLANIAIQAVAAGLGPMGQSILKQLNQAGDLITQIVRDPGKFFFNFMKAIGQGFERFGQNAEKWMKKGLGEWLSGSANVQFPSNLNPEGILITALSIMNLTYTSLRNRLVQEIGPQKVAQAEKAGRALFALTGGLHQAPELKKVSSQLGTQVLDSMKTEISKTLLFKGLQKIASLFNPATAALQTVMTAWNAIETVIDKQQQMIQLFSRAMSSVQAIAAGHLDGAATSIEATIGGSLSIGMTFLGKVAGLGDPTKWIRNMVKTLRKKLRIDDLIDGLMKRLKQLVGAVSLKAGSKTSNGVLVAPLKPGMPTPKNKAEANNQRYASETSHALEALGKSEISLEKLRPKAEERAKQLETKYNKVIEKPAKMSIRFRDSQIDKKSQNIGFHIHIGPNDTDLDGNIQAAHDLMGITEADKKIIEKYIMESLRQLGTDHYTKDEESGEVKLGEKGEMVAKLSTQLAKIGSAYERAKRASAIPNNVFEVTGIKLFVDQTKHGYIYPNERVEDTGGSAMYPVNNITDKDKKYFIEHMNTTKERTTKEYLGNIVDWRYIGPVDLTMQNDYDYTKNPINIIQAQNILKSIALNQRNGYNATQLIPITVNSCAFHDLTRLEGVGTKRVTDVEWANRCCSDLYTKQT